MSKIDLSQFSMLDLFRVEAETQAQVLTSGLLALERDHTLADQLEACMRAAHSLKGAARIVGLAVGVRVAHAMEDCFVAAQGGRLVLGHTHIDLLLGATDLLARIAHTLEADLGQWENEKKSDVDVCLTSLGGILTGDELVQARGVTLIGGSRPTPAALRALAQAALGEAVAGRLRPLVGQTFPLESAADAHAAMERRATVGKTLLLAHAA